MPADLPVTSQYRDHDDRCISCGADIDHYLGCPDDPNPDYEAEAQLQERGSLEELGWESLGHGNAPMGEL